MVASRRARGSSALCMAGAVGDRDRGSNWELGRVPDRPLCCSPRSRRATSPPTCQERRPIWLGWLLRTSSQCSSRQTVAPCDLPRAAISDHRPANARLSPPRQALCTWRLEVSTACCRRRQHARQPSPGPRACGGCWQRAGRCWSPPAGRLQTPRGAGTLPPGPQSGADPNATGTHRAWRHPTRSQPAGPPSCSGAALRRAVHVCAAQPAAQVWCCAASFIALLLKPNSDYCDQKALQVLRCPLLSKQRSDERPQGPCGPRCRRRHRRANWASAPSAPNAPPPPTHPHTHAHMPAHPSPCPPTRCAQAADPGGADAGEPRAAAPAGGHAGPAGAGAGGALHPHGQ